MEHGSGTFFVGTVIRWDDYWDVYLHPDGRKSSRSFRCRIYKKNNDALLRALTAAESWDAEVEYTKKERGGWTNYYLTGIRKIDGLPVEMFIEKRDRLIAAANPVRANV